MRTHFVTVASAVATTVLLIGSASADAQTAASPAGLWDATVVVPTGPSKAPVPTDIPFRFEIACAGKSCAQPRGSFFNGDEKVTSTRGTFSRGALSLTFDEYGAALEATLAADGTLSGQYTRGTRGAPYPFHAKRFVAVDAG